MRPRLLGSALGYFVGSLISIASYAPRPMRVRIGGAVREGRHLVVVAANGTYFGGGMRIAPDAKLDDGMLDIIVGGDLGKWESFVALLKIYRGTHLPHPGIVELSATRLSLESDRPLPIEADGEALGVTPATFEVLPRPLSLKV